MPKRRPKRKAPKPTAASTTVPKQQRQKKKPKLSRRKQNESSLGGKSKKKKSTTRPTTLQDENGQDVWIATATLADIGKTRRTKRPPFIKNRQYMYNIPAAQQRNECYERAAAAWQDMEQSLLPKYGNRPWQVIVRISDPTNSKNKTPYFVFGRRTGLLELAAWPHLLLKIPNPPRFPGYEQRVKKQRQEEVQEPVKRPPANKQQEEEEEEEEEENDEDADEEVETSEDAEEEEEGEEEEPSEEQSQGADDEDEESDDVEEASEKSEVDDDEETSDDEKSEEEEEEEEDLLDAAVADLQERCVTPLSTLAWELRMQVPLPHVTVKWISPLLESYSSRTSAWDRAMQLARHEVFLDRTLLGVDTASGKQVPIIASKASIKKSNDDNKGNKSSIMASSTSSSVISKRVALKAGKLRFERDGLWVIGQEEEWQQERWMEDTTTANNATLEERTETGPSPNKKRGGGGGDGGCAVSSSSSNTKRNLTALALYLQCNRRAHQAQRLQEMTAASASTGQHVQFTLRQAETELRSMWKTSLTEEERLEWGRRAAAEAAAVAEVATSAMVPPNKNGADEEENGRKMPATTETTAENTTEPLTTSTTAVCVTPTTTCEAPENRTAAGVGGLDSSSSSSCTTARRRLVVSPDEPSVVEGAAAAAASASTASTASASVDVAAMPLLLPPPSSMADEDDANSGNLFVPSTYWRLNKEQIRLCYDAGIEHYETIMATVKARDLSRELQDGFDLLRERGRGRFDMELPVFDTPAFRFLTDLKKAPWMPVVRQILGKEVALIHKGMFLSLPGAETQEYHQDGVHLNTQYQKPCHAINVFTPLIDLTLKSGPTEFCLGSHFLGQEEYNRDFLETPLVKAGTPVVFDYRLGHKGLCNQSNECRPIVYCTYAPAAGGSEFRDSVNFSRKRYHRIGDLVRQGPTREERARKRKLVAEEQEAEQERIQDHAAKSVSETARTESTNKRVSRRDSKRRQLPSTFHGESSRVDFV